MIKFFIQVWRLSVDIHTSLYILLFVRDMLFALSKLEKQSNV